MWVPSKSALERESWAWDRGDVKSGKFVRTKEKMGASDGGCYRLTERLGRGERTRSQGTMVGCEGLKT